MPDRFRTSRYPEYFGYLTLSNTVLARCRVQQSGNLFTWFRPKVVPARRLGSRGERREKMTRMRQRIATRLKEAQNTTAMLTTFQEVRGESARACSDGSVSRHRYSSFNMLGGKIWLSKFAVPVYASVL